MAADGEYVRWRNSKEPGALMFVTTTVLGYTPALRNAGDKALLLHILASDCRHHGALLHAYCVMEHHLHLVIRAPLHMEMSRFMQGFKRRSAHELLKTASPSFLRRLRETGKDNRSFWMRSFRGVPVRSEEVMWLASNTFTSIRFERGSASGPSTILGRRPSCSRNVVGRRRTGFCLGFSKAPRRRLVPTIVSQLGPFDSWV